MHNNNSEIRCLVTVAMKALVEGVQKIRIHATSSLHGGKKGKDERQGKPQNQMKT